MKIQKKYFVFTENQGYIEAADWCETLEEAKRLVKVRKHNFPNEAENVYIGEIIE